MVIVMYRRPFPQLEMAFLRMVLVLQRLIPRLLDLRVNVVASVLIFRPTWKAPPSARASKALLERTMLCDIRHWSPAALKLTVLGTVTTPLCSIPPLDLPFDFQWFGETAVRNLDVSNYGEIYIGADFANQNRTGRGQPVEIGGFNDRGRIAVASSDFPGSSTSVDVWILMKETSVIISWSAVLRETGMSYEAQAELYANGKVDLRWNDGRNFGLVGLTIAAGIEDDTRLIPEAFPATGFPFGDGGQALNFGFPRGQCRRFKLQYG